MSRAACSLADKRTGPEMEWRCGDKAEREREVRVGERERESEGTVPRTLARTHVWQRPGKREKGTGRHAASTEIQEWSDIEVDSHRETL